MQILQERNTQSNSRKSKTIQKVPLCCGGRAAAGEARMQAMTRDLIDAALSTGGSFFGPRGLYYVAGVATRARSKCRVVTSYVGLAYSPWARLAGSGCGLR